MKSVSISDLMKDSVIDEPTCKFSPGFSFAKTTHGTELFTLGIWKYGWELSFRYRPNHNIWITFDWWRYE